KPRVSVKQTSFQENLLYIAWPVPKATHADIPALDVLSLIFGQGESSRLNRALRLEKSLVNYAGASTFTPQDPGFFAISSSLAYENLPATLETINAELEHLLSEPPTSE